MLLFLLVLAASSLTLERRFSQFLIKFNKTYDGREFFKRLSIFNESLHRVEALNARDGSKHSVYGITKFSDLSEQETKHLLSRPVNRKKLKRKYGSKVPTWQGECFSCVRFPNMTGSAIPVNFDWRNQGAVTGVKDQGRCGDCYAFGATGDMEASHYLAGNDLVGLSEQQITSCDNNGDDQGCRGGATDLDTFGYVIKTGGICSNKEYPESQKTFKYGLRDSCDDSKLHDFAAKFSSCMQISGGGLYPVDSDKVKAAIYNLGSLSTGLNSDGADLDDYNSGILKPRNCKNTIDDLDHEVLIVGWGEEASVPYWLVKNSYGSEWGENGFFRIYRGNNVCGVVTDTTNSVV